ncbi:MAG: pyridoxal phosphate-dependent aminotransferase [Phycisphaerales bacterium JB052]
MTQIDGIDLNSLVSDRASAIDASGIRRIFALAASLKDPINLSIGQPDFTVPEAIKRAAIDAIDQDVNGYTLTQGLPLLLSKVNDWLKMDLGWDAQTVNTPGHDGPVSFITSGTSGALLLAFMVLLNPGDECIIADPYFVAYPHIATLCGATAIPVDTYPDFRLTAQRVAEKITDKTKFVLFNTPSNPCGVVPSKEECAELRNLCRSRGVLLISDEIYDEFAFSDFTTDTAVGDPSLKRCPSPARLPGAHEDTLLIRGFGKTYGCTGWRLGYAAGPRAIIEQMAKLQQYTFVCAPSPLQAGVEASFETSMQEHVDEYEKRRDLVQEKLGGLTEIATPGGAFYAFIKVPEHLGLTGSQFTEKAIEREVLVIPGGAFSQRDTHFRISFATQRDKLVQGLDILAELMQP